MSRSKLKSKKGPVSPTGKLSTHRPTCTPDEWSARPGHFYHNTQTNQQQELHHVFRELATGLAEAHPHPEHEKTAGHQAQAGSPGGPSGPEWQFPAHWRVSRHWVRLGGQHGAQYHLHDWRRD